jgi:hypothetical protein
MITTVMVMMTVQMGVMRQAAIQHISKAAYCHTITMPLLTPLFARVLKNKKLQNYYNITTYTY